MLGIQINIKQNYFSGRGWFELPMYCLEQAEKLSEDIVIGQSEGIWIQ